MRKILNLLFVLALVVTAQAKEKLSKNQQKAVQQVHEWLSPDKAQSSVGFGGAVNFMYGTSIPVVLAAPLQTTNIELEPGESVLEAFAGDTVRWIVAPALVGEGNKQISVVVIKPTEAGLSTLLSVFTNKRPYYIQLRSTERDYYPVVTFSYPEKVKEKWDAYYKQKANDEEKKKLAVIDNDSKDAQPRNIDTLDFAYDVVGNTSWKPLRVYNDGVQTYIQMPEELKYNEAPALLVLDRSGDEKIVNYRLKGDRYVVDKLFEKAELILGVGDNQEKIEITRKRK